MAANRPHDTARQDPDSPSAHRPKSAARRVIEGLGTVGALVATVTALVVGIKGLWGEIKTIGDDPKPANGAPAPAGAPTAAPTVAGPIATSPTTTTLPGATRLPTGGASTSDGVPLFTLPATSAGSKGQQAGPLETVIAGVPRGNATAVPCEGMTPPPVTFYTDGRYRKLSGIAGLDERARPDTTVTFIVWAGDGTTAPGPWQWFSIERDKPATIDLDISRFAVIGLSASAPGGCGPKSSKRHAYLADGVVF